MTSAVLKNAVVRLLRERPFYGHFILNLRREERILEDKAAGVTVRDGIPTLVVDGRRFGELVPRQQRAAGAPGQTPAAPSHAATQRAQPARLGYRLRPGHQPRH